MADAAYHPGFWIQACSGWISILGYFRRKAPLKTRASRFLEGLESGPGARRDLAVLQARHDFDLVYEDANAIDETVRAVQIRFLALADEYRVVAEFLDLRFQKAPIMKLFMSILAQAEQDGASAIEIGPLTIDSKRFSVRYLIDDEWQSIMACPALLFAPLRGFAFLVRDASAKGLGHRIAPQEARLAALEFDLCDDRAIRIGFPNGRAEALTH